MKCKKLKDMEFLKNIIIGIVSLVFVAIIINIAPGYKRDKYKDIINLIINEENKTKDLKHNIYVNKNGTIYISEEDVKNLFDATIYHDEKYNQIITTSDTKVANIVINEKKMIVNNSEISMLDEIIKIDDNIYLPISNMCIVYNIDIKYIKDTNNVIIDKLDEGMITARVVKESKIKFKPRNLSKNVGIIQAGETVNCFYTTSKGWRQIRASDGNLGYVKANKLTSEYILRQDIIKRPNAVKISKNLYNNKEFTILNNMVTKKVIVKEIFNISDDNIKINKDEEEQVEKNKIWISISNKSFQSLGKQINLLLEDYKSRTQLINEILNKLTRSNIKGVSIDFYKVDKNNMMRFIIELAPKLRNLGITSAIVLNNNINAEDVMQIVDYVIE